MVAGLGILGIGAALRFRLTRFLPPDIQIWGFLAIGAMGVGFLLLGVAAVMVDRGHP